MLEFHYPVTPPGILKKRDALERAECQVGWSGDERLRDENMEGVGPGGWLSRFGWYVVGTTVGGNAVVVREDDPAVYFADHTWYSDFGIHYQDLAGDGSWIPVPLTAEGVRRSLFRLADSVEDFVARVAEIDALIDRID